MPDLCGQRARRGRLFAFDANGELIETPTPAGDASFSRGAAGSSRGAVPPLTEIVSSDLLDSPFPERAVQSPKRSVPSKTVDGLGASEARYAALAKRSAQTADCLMRRVSRHRAKGK